MILCCFTDRVSRDLTREHPPSTEVGILCIEDAVHLGSDFMMDDSPVVLGHDVNSEFLLQSIRDLNAI